eukprot:TRINITY_DN4299_c0_g2_i2.p1 TRINITY_DN4299_c0_g2~~TRINITY_DN4299_c0_g2_i2.p1  ORF type:complete len:104 (+),score=10.68 TRINITY_DN4299_c0_g2_i2:101-412(+)
MKVFSNLLEPTATRVCSFSTTNLQQNDNQKHPEFFNHEMKCVSKLPTVLYSVEKIRPIVCKEPANRKIRKLFSFSLQHLSFFNILYPSLCQKINQNTTLKLRP